MLRLKVEVGGYSGSKKDTLDLEPENFSMVLQL